MSIVLRHLLLLGTSFLIATSQNEDLIADEPKIESAVSTNLPDLTRLTETQWNRIDASIDRAISFLLTQQQPDGSFPSYITAKPGVTSLCVMAMLSRGHLPGNTIHGEAIDRAIDFILSTQRPDGLFTEASVHDAVAPRFNGSHVCLYNHGICGTMLGEVYGCTDSPRTDLIATAIERALAFTRSRQISQASNPMYDERGGWRYYGPHFDGSQSDLSVASWQLMFLRSAENAGFDVPKDYADDAIAYVKRCYVPESGGFRYRLHHPKVTRAMTGAGVTCLFLAGQHNQMIEKTSGQWLTAHQFDRVYDGEDSLDRFFYGAYYCSLASLQIGGECWASVYPPLSNTLLEYQQSDGSWPAAKHDVMFGNAYTTAMALLALTPPYQLLPIYQR